MELIPRHFPNVGVVEGQLPEDVTENIWTVIKEARDQPEDMKSELAGNISSSIRLDSSSPLLEQFVGEILPSFMDNHIQNYGAPWRAVMKEGQGFSLESLWVNFQRQHEFNPPHDHSGVFSFVIWMQIPTSYAEQKKLPICVDSNADRQFLLLCVGRGYLHPYYKAKHTRQGIHLCIQYGKGSRRIHGYVPVTNASPSLSVL